MTSTSLYTGMRGQVHLPQKGILNYFIVQWECEGFVANFGETFTLV